MHRSPRLIGTVSLLILALVVCAVLAYQGWDAARSQQRTADGALHDYAKIADWQLTQQAKNALLSQVVTSLSGPASRLDPAALASTVVSPAQVEDIARRNDELVRLPVGRAVLLPLRLARRNVPHHRYRPARRRSRLGARHDGRLHEKSSGRKASGRTLSFWIAGTDSSDRCTNLAVVITNDSYAMLFGERNRAAGARRVRRGA